MLVFVFSLLASVLFGDSGKTTRYWDCCKGSCGWEAKADVSKPIDTCAKDGTTRVASNDTVKSGCDGGDGYMCYDQTPWGVNDSYALGFAAAAISGGEKAACCNCYELTFTSGPVNGKKMTVQVTNTGGDLGSNQFDLAIPGGGVGIYNGCTAQSGAPADGWGSRYGGVSSRSECSQLPSGLQAGCQWRFDWFQNADNPSMNFNVVSCPSELIAKTNCRRN
uniref:Cellulase n=2 Tax=Reticulitermes speratus hindgut protist 130484 TaxID=130484 RepID=Q9JH83_9EUKA|nr:family 45 cellulase homologue [Reticulitermes speratus hindgut protist 130484]BAA98037.1 family 45 cellulase homologue [Reticulitermes speratus hindgut protist 130484]